MQVKFYNRCIFFYIYGNIFLDTPQKRLSDFILARYVNKVSFAERIGMSKENLAKYLRSNGLVFSTPKTQQKLRDAGLNVEWYLTGEGSMDTKDSPLLAAHVPPDIKFSGDVEFIYESDLIEVPLIDSAFPCGVPEPNEGKIIKVLVPKRIVAEMKDPYLLKCKGDSMSPRIEDGDYIVVETFNGDLTQLDNESIVVAYINNEFTVKRIFQQGDIFMLVPENLNGHKPYVLAPHDEMSIIARVLRVAKIRDC